MKALLKKEFLLCLHPTCFIFLCFAAFVFIPNYPYEVMFFFSGLSVFFVCLTARENGDTAFTASLPVKKGGIAVARICFCVLFQAALLLLAGVCTAIKETVFPPENQINMAGTAANLAFLANGAVCLGVFNLTFFPVYFSAPHKVGKPFVLASVAVFALILLSIICRFAVPLWRDVLNTPDPQHFGAKIAYFCIGFAIYALFTVFSAFLSKKKFEAVDL